MQNVQSYIYGAVHEFQDAHRYCYVDTIIDTLCTCTPPGLLCKHRYSDHTIMSQTAMLKFLKPSGTESEDNQQGFSIQGKHER